MLLGYLSLTRLALCIACGHRVMVLLYCMSNGNRKDKIMFGHALQSGVGMSKSCFVIEKLKRIKREIQTNGTSNQPLKLAFVAQMNLLL